MEFGVHLPTIHLMTTVIFGLQAVVIAFQLPLGRRYRGIGAFLGSALLLAAGSGLLLANGFPDGGPPDLPPPSGPGLPPGGPPGPAGVFLWSSLLTLAGTAVQYLALAGFLGRKPSRVLLVAVAAVGLGLWLAVGLRPDAVPAVPVREALTAPLLLAIVLVLAASGRTPYRLGVFVTGLPFLGYLVLSGYRIVRGLLDPAQMLPGPRLNDAVDALVLFGLSFLWTAGFLLMVNQRLQADLEALASQDPLTGCLNRRAMSARLETELDRFRRYGRPFSVLLIDLDRFKRINDDLGHEAGDRVLTGTVAALKAALRSGDSLARWGGEEFLVLLPETEAGAAYELAERLRRLVAEHPFGLEGRTVTLSAGVAAVREGLTADELCALADRALYRAKETRNRVVAAEGA